MDMPVGFLGRDWRADAVCLEIDAELLFSTAEDQRLAKQVCRRCPAIQECLVEALDNRIEFGVWGGMTERERRVLLRKRPDVHSWSDLIKVNTSAKSA